MRELSLVRRLASACIIPFPDRHVLPHITTYRRDKKCSANACGQRVTLAQMPVIMLFMMAPTPLSTQVSILFGLVVFVVLTLSKKNG